MAWPDLYEYEDDLLRFFNDTLKGSRRHLAFGVTGDGNLETGGDGVVKYKSAHIEGVESELVVPYEDSIQSRPEVISAVQRILHHHLELNACVTDATKTSQSTRAR